MAMNKKNSKAAKKTVMKPAAAKGCKTAKSAAKGAKPTAAKKQLSVKIPTKVANELKKLAKELGVDFAGACAYNITINLMRCAQMTKPEYTSAIKDLAKRYGIAPDRFPAYIIGGDPEELKRFEAFCAKNSTVAKADAKAVGKVMSGAAKAAALGKLTVTNDKPVKIGKKTAGKVAKK